MIYVFDILLLLLLSQHIIELKHSNSLIYEVHPHQNIWGLAFSWLKYSNTEQESLAVWMRMCCIVCVCVCVPCSTDLGWSCLERRGRPLGLDSPAEPPDFRPEPAWPGSALSWSSAQGIPGHQERSSRWRAARRTPRAGGGRTCRQWDVKGSLSE